MDSTVAMSSIKERRVLPCGSRSSRKSLGIVGALERQYMFATRHWQGVATLEVDAPGRTDAVNRIRLKGKPISIEERSWALRKSPFPKQEDQAQGHIAFL